MSRKEVFFLRVWGEKGEENLPEIQKAIMGNE